MRSVWIFPLAIPLVLVVLMTFIYIGAVLNPTARLHGLPVMVVDQDKGALVNGQRVDEGDTVVHALDNSSVVSTKLALRTTSLDAAKAAMDRGDAYATIVIPAGFTDSLLAAAGDEVPGTGGPCSPRCGYWRMAGSAVWGSTWRRESSLQLSSRSHR
jgi:YhgE/Pip-like protein